MYVASNLGIGTTGPTSKLTISGGGLSVQGNKKTNAYDHININRGSPYTYTNIVETDWGGTHDILYGGYVVGESGSLTALGNTKYANAVGAYSNGAAMSSYINNGGQWDFLIAPTSTGADTNIDWSNTQVLTLQRNRNVLMYGNVGIGTTDPGAKLEVNGTFSSAGITKLNSNTLYVGYSPINGQTPNSSLGSRFYMGFVALQSEFPSSYGHIFGTWDANGVAGPTPGYAYQLFKPYDGSYLQYRHGVSGPAWSPWETVITSRQNPATFTYGATFGGNVGIGTASPQAGLEVNSSSTDVVSFHNTAGTGLKLIGGQQAWTAISDERAKDILGNIENATGKLSNLRTVYFKFKTEGEHNRRVGLIAQDVQKVLPEVVDTDSKGYLGIRYTELIPLIIRGFQEQQKEIESLKAELTGSTTLLLEVTKTLKAQTKEIADLKTEIVSLEGKVVKGQ